MRNISLKLYQTSSPNAQTNNIYGFTTLISEAPPNILGIDKEILKDVILEIIRGLNNDSSRQIKHFISQYNPNTKEIFSVFLYKSSQSDYNNAIQIYYKLDDSDPFSQGIVPVKFIRNNIRSNYLTITDQPLNVIWHKKFQSILKAIRNPELYLAIIYDLRLPEENGYNLLTKAAERGYITFTDIDNIFFSNIYSNSSDWIVLHGGENPDFEYPPSLASHKVWISQDTALYSTNKIFYFTSADNYRPLYVNDSSGIITIYEEKRQAIGGNIYRYDLASLYAFILYRNSDLTIQSQFYTYSLFNSIANLVYYNPIANNINIFTNELKNLLITNGLYNVSILNRDDFSILDSLNRNYRDFYNKTQSLLKQIYSVFSSSYSKTALGASLTIPYDNANEIEQLYNTRKLENLKNNIQLSALYRSLESLNRVEINDEEYITFYSIGYTSNNNSFYKFLNDIGFILLPQPIEDLDSFKLYNRIYAAVNGNIKNYSIYSNNANTPDIIVQKSNRSILGDKTLILKPVNFIKKISYPDTWATAPIQVNTQTPPYEFINLIDSTKTVDSQSIFAKNSAIVSIDFNLKINKETQNNELLDPDISFNISGIAYAIEEVPENFAENLKEIFKNIGSERYHKPYDRDNSEITDKILNNYIRNPLRFPLPAIHFGDRNLKVPILSRFAIFTINQHFNQNEYYKRLYDATYSIDQTLKQVIDECINILNTYAPDRTNDIANLRSFNIVSHSSFENSSYLRGSIANNKGVLTIQKIYNEANEEASDILYLGLNREFIDNIGQFQDNKWNSYDDFVYNIDIQRSQAQDVYITKVNTQRNPQTYSYTVSTSFSLQPYDTSKKIPIKYIEVFRQNGAIGRYNQIRIKGYAQSSNTQTSRYVEIFLTNSDVQNIIDTQTNSFRVYLKDYLNQDEYFYNGLNVEIEYYKPYYEFEWYDTLFIKFVPVIEEYSASATISNRIVFEPLNLDYAFLQLKFNRNTIINQQTYNIYISPQIFNIRDNLQDYLTDNKKVIVFNNFLKGNGDSLNYTTLNSLLEGDLTAASNDFYILDQANLNFSYNSSGNTRYLKPVLIDDFYRKYVRGYVKISLLDASASLSLFDIFNAYNAFNPGATDATKGILFLEGYISDYTAGYSYNDLLKLYKLTLTLRTISNVIEDIQVPVKFDFYYEIYDSLEDFTNDNRSGVFNFSSIENLTIKSSASYLNTYRDFTPKILFYIPWEDIYGTDRRTDYIFDLYLTLETRDVNVLRLSQVNFDILKYTSDVQFAVPNNFTDLTTATSLENAINNLINIEQTQDKEKILDFVNHYVRTKGSENLYSSRLTFKFKIKLKPLYYGLNYASLVLNSYVFNSRNEFIIPYVFYKYSASSLMTIYKKSNIDYIKKPLHEFIRNRFKTFTYFPTNILERITQYYRFPEKSYAEIKIFNSSTLRKVLEIRYVENTSGKIPRSTSSLIIPFNPLENKLFRLEEILDARDYTNNQSGFIKFDIIDKDTNVKIDEITIPIPSLEDSIQQQLNFVNNIGLQTEENSATNIRTIESEEENNKNLTQSSTGEFYRTIKALELHQINKDVYEYKDLITNSIKIYFDKVIYAQISEEDLRNILSITGNTNYLANGYLVGLFLPFDSFNSIQKISNIEIKSSIFTYKTDVNQLYLDYREYYDLFPDETSRPLDYTNFIIELSTNFCQVSFPISNNGIPYYTLYFSRQDLLKQQFNIKYPIFISIVNPLNDIIRKALTVAYYKAYKNRITLLEAKNIIAGLVQADIEYISLKLHIRMFDVKPLISALFLAHQNYTNILQDFLNIPKGNITNTLQQKQIDIDKNYIDKYGTIYEYSCKFVNENFTSNIRSLAIITDNVKYLIKDSETGEQTDVESIQANLHADVDNRLLNSIIAQALKFKEDEISDINFLLKRKRLYSQPTLQQVNYTFSTKNNLDISDAYIRIKAGDKSYPESTNNLFLPFKFILNTKELNPKNVNGDVFVIEKSLLPDSIEQNCVIYGAGKGLNYIGVDINNRPLGVIINVDYYVYLQSLDYFRKKTAIDIVLNDSKITRGSLFGKENKYVVIQTTQDSEFKIFGKLTGKISRYVEGYLTINSIELLSNMPDNVKVIVKFADGDTYIGDYNQRINIGKTFSKYKPESIASNFSELDIHLAGILSTTGEYKNVLRLTYTYLGEQKNITFSFGVFVSRPASTDNEYLILTHERLDNSLDYNPEDIKALENAHKNFLKLQRNSSITVKQNAFEGQPGHHFPLPFQDGSDE